MELIDRDAAQNVGPVSRELVVRDGDGPEEVPVVDPDPSPVDDLPQCVDSGSAHLLHPEGGDDLACSVIAADRV
ncbi:hypothetical protein ACQ1ZK_17765, partial [Enterococcus faecium]